MWACFISFFCGAAIWISSLKWNTLIYVNVFHWCVTFISKVHVNYLPEMTISHVQRMNDIDIFKQNIFITCSFACAQMTNRGQISLSVILGNFYTIRTQLRRSVLVLWSIYYRHVQDTFSGQNNSQCVKYILNILRELDLQHRVMALVFGTIRAYSSLSSLRKPNIISSKSVQ